MTQSSTNTSPAVAAKSEEVNPTSITSLVKSRNMNASPPGENTSFDKLRFAFHSTMAGMPWGGSEELWYQTASRLQSEGHEILVNYQWWPEPPQKLLKLQKGGARITFRNQPPKSTPMNKIRGWWQSMREQRAQKFWLKNQRPDAVIVTAAYHVDAIPLVSFCRRKGIPYAINVQCASNSAFINERRFDQFREAYEFATRVYFVSPENRSKVETNIALKLDNAEIIENPYNVSRDVPLTWPECDSPLKLACVGRVHFVSKGQDLIVHVLRREKWRNRPIKVRIFGSDQGNERQLRDLIRLHQLEDKIELAGYSDDIQAVWRNHHALILPSRYEGAALAIVEAMMCHRVAITTDTGRNRELIDDNETGFVAVAPTADQLDEALERAWQVRSQWKEMGQLAGERIRGRVHADPVDAYKKRLLQLARLRHSV